MSASARHSLAVLVTALAQFVTRTPCLAEEPPASSSPLPSGPVPALGVGASGAPLGQKSSATPGEQPSEPQVRIDPEGVRGMLPWMIPLARGDAAFLARDFSDARRHYREAIKLAPQAAAAHLRMVQLHLHLHELEEADAALLTALRFVADDLPTKAQAFALLALLREQQALSADALSAWAAYAELGEPASSRTTKDASSAEVRPAGSAQLNQGSGQASKQGAGQATPPRVFKETAMERSRAIAAQKKAADAAAPVRALIERRLAEAEDKLNPGSGR